MPGKHVFLSYCHENAEEVRRLCQDLVAAGFGVWWDQELLPGQDWKHEIRQAMKNACAVVLCLSEEAAARQRSGIFPEARQAIDVSQELRPGSIFLIPVRLSECPIPSLPLDGNRDLDQLQSVDLFPETGRQRNLERLVKALRTACGGATPPHEDPSPVDVEIDRLPSGGRHFVAREEELRRLDDAWADAHVHAISIVAWGGVGKSALVDRWLTSLERDDWRGARRVYGWSFYSQGTEDRLTSADAFVDDALAWFGDPDPSVGSPRDRGLRLARLVRREKTLLVLDGVEPLQHPPGPLAGRFKDPALAALVKSLARSNDGLLVISTREAVEEIAHLEDASAPRLDLGTFSDDDGAALLELLGVRGTLKERRKASSQHKGHALALSLLGTYLVKACEGEIRQLPEIELDVADGVAQGGHAWRVIAAYERWLGEREVSVLRLLGFFDRPADPEALAVLRAGPVVEDLNDGLVDLDDRSWNVTLSNLRDCGLLSEEGGEAPSRRTLDAHPLVRAWFGRELERRHPSAWRAGHERLYVYFKNAAPELPNTLDEMLPLYAAVVHGCRAGKHDEAFNGVYWPRIRRENEGYSIKKLGAFGADLVAVGSFFVRPWDEVVAGLSDEVKAWLFTAAGFRLRALGRLTEALEPISAGQAINISNKDWKNAAIQASNVSELSLTLGDVTRAVTSGEESVELADKSGDDFQRMANRTTLADALHQAGRWEDAAKAFREAEAMQAEWQPSYPRLCSLPGYRYCDLLLGPVRRHGPGPGAWSGLDRLVVEDGDVGRFPRRGTDQELWEACEDVRGRATYAIEIAEQNNWILDIALDHLSLGRAHFGRTLCGEGAGEDGSAESAKVHLDRAVEGLRKAGEEEFIGRGLLARAAFRRVFGDRTSARDDLDEAEEIAERGQMLLFLADVHLERTHLHLASGEDARARERLDAAAELVERCGYGRRRRDLEFLEGLLGKRSQGEE